MAAVCERVRLAQIDLAPRSRISLVSVHRDHLPEKQVVRAKMQRLRHLALDAHRTLLDHGGVDHLRRHGRQAIALNLSSAWPDTVPHQSTTRTISAVGTLTANSPDSFTNLWNSATGGC